jgi:putative ABC transport system permease protein
VRTSLRAIRRHPALAATVFATVALGVGLATALYLYLDFFLHPRLAAPRAEQVAAVYLGQPDDSRSPATFLEYQRLLQTEAFHDTIAASPIGASVGTGEGSRFAWGRFVDGSFFKLFGTRSGVGRVLLAGDDQPGAAPAIVLGYSLWRDDFGSDPGVVGRSIRVNSTRLTVVGVLPQDFTGLGYAAAFFIPLRQSDSVSGVSRLGAPDNHWLRLLTRLPQGLHLEQAQSVLATVASDLDRATPLAQGKRTPQVLPATHFDPVNRDDPFFQAARLLAGAALLFLVLGSANVAGLLQASVASREREWAVRKALGAPGWSLMRGIILEHSLPSLAGLAASFGIAVIATRWLGRMAQTPLGGIGSGWSAGEQMFGVDANAATFAGVAALLAMGGALLPSILRVMGSDPNRSLRSDDPHFTSQLRSRRTLVTVELALAVVLVVGGTLLARSLSAAASAPLGFNPHGLTSLSLYLPRTAEGKTAMKVWNDLLDRARRLPGVESATLVHVAPNAGWSRAAKVAPVESPNTEKDVHYNLVASAYFSTLGVPIEAGRALDQRDTPRSPPVVVVSHSLAARLYPRQRAVGHQIRVAGAVKSGEAGPDFEIVGVSADAATTSALEGSAPTVYFAYGQRVHARMALVVRSAAPLAILEPRLRDALRTAAPEAAVVDLLTVDEQFARSLYAFRMNAILATSLAGLGLLTAVAGLLALQFFAVNLRRKEFGIRMALGAKRGQVAQLVLRETAALALAGAVIGLAGAVGMTRWLQSLLYGVGALDPWTLGLVTVGLVALVFIAGWIPSRRAMRADPAETLRGI